MARKTGNYFHTDSEGNTRELSVQERKAMVAGEVPDEQAEVEKSKAEAKSNSTTKKGREAK